MVGGELAKAFMDGMDGWPELIRRNGDGLDG